MNRTLIIATLTCLPLTFAGCNRSDAAESLPPATGSGAPTMPTLPTLASNSTEDNAVENQALRATCTTLALHQAELGPKMSGLLAAVLVDEGDKVKKGQPLFRLEATNMALGARQAEAGRHRSRRRNSRWRWSWRLQTRPEWARFEWARSGWTLPCRGQTESFPKAQTIRRIVRRILSGQAFS